MLLIWSGGASAKTGITYDNIGWCAPYYAGTIYTLRPAYSETTTYPGPSYSLDIRYAVYYEDQYVNVCQEIKNWYEDGLKPDDNPDWQDLKKKIQRDYKRRQFLNNVNGPKYQQHRGVCGGLSGACYPASGVRGSIKTGHVITTASPGYMTFEAGPINFTGTGEVLVPFLITSKAPGDWLAFSVNGELFWGADLDELELDELYWVAIPDDIVQGQDPLNAWDFYLGNGENGYSEVIFPTTFNANICSASVSTTEPDADADGIIDSCDDCPDSAGAAVEGNGCTAGPIDSDADGVSDTADLCPNTAASWGVVDQDGCAIAQLLDMDKDGHNNPVDNCPLIPNFDQVDTDGDGRGDVCTGLPPGC